MMPTSATGRRPDGSTDHAACARVAAAAPATPTLVALERAWIGGPGWDRPLARLRAAWHYYVRLRRRRLYLEVPPGQLPDCPACRESCCCAPHLVSLRLVDIARLHDCGLGWAITSPGDRSEVYVAHPELRAAERRPAFREFPVLRHSSAGVCVFLDAAACCSIYPLRPLACRAFPYRLGDDLRSVRYSAGCSSSRTDGTLEEQGVLAAAVAANYDAKARDMMTLQFDRATLMRLGFSTYLPGAERGRRFAAAIERARGEGTQSDG